VIGQFVVAAARPGSREGEKLRTVSRATVGALVLAYACLIPQISSDYVVGLVILMAIYAIVNMGWNLVFGYGGVLAFGQLAFFAIGGYAAVLANIHWHASPWEDIWFGGAVAGVAGLLIGIPSLRLYGPYMILFTLAFQLALQSLWPNVWTNITGGSAGIFSGIDTFAVGGAYYITVTAYVAIGLVLLTYLVISLVLRSPIGHAMEALREGRAQAEARGISFFQHRVILFVISAFLTGVAGGLYAHNNAGVTPAMLDVGLLINIFAMLALGGIGTKVGPILGAVIGVYLNDTLSATQQYSQLIWGGILIGVVMVAPSGIVGLLSRVLLLIRDRLLLPAFAQWAPAAAVSDGGTGPAATRFVEKRPGVLRKGDG
jgi:branched-chain amino acid transport system permease protein